MNTRTDMAHEALQRCPELAGVAEENESKGRMRISRIRVRTQAASRKLDKPKGSYITLTLPEDGLSSREVRQEAGRCLAADGRLGAPDGGKPLRHPPRPEPLPGAAPKGDPHGVRLRRGGHGRHGP